MNYTEKKLSLLSQIDVIAQNDYINDTYQEYCFHGIKFIVINHVYYYFKSYEEVRIQLEKNHLHCVVLSIDNYKHDFEIKYSDINDIMIQIE